MTDSQKVLPDYLFNIVNPTLNFKDIDGILPWLDNVSSYVLIPAIPSQALLDPWQIVLKLLPLSHNILIDICLPYEHPKQFGIGSIRHTARYLILNQKLLGIRVRTNEEWRKYRIQKIRLPHSIKRFYNQELNLNQHVCEVGHFYLSFRHFKLAPIFESELDGELSLLSQYERYGCQVFAITDDIQRKKIGDLSRIQTRLSEKGQITKNIYLYTGVKTSLHPLSCYWTNAHAQYDNILKKCSVNPFGNGAQIQVSINFMNSRKHKIFQDIKSLDYTKNIIMGLDFRNQFIKFQTRNPKKNTQQVDLPAERPTNQTLLMMYTWFLFNIVNQRKPFIVGAPFTEKIACLVHTLKQLKQYFQKTNLLFPNKILSIYKLKKAVEIKTENLWPPSLKNFCEECVIYESFDSMLQQNSSSPILIYTDSVHDISTLTEMLISYPIKICSSLLNDQFLTAYKADPFYLRKEEVVRSHRRDVQKLCDEILSKKYDTLEEMVRLFMRRSNNNVEEERQAFTEIIPKKLKMNVSLHPPHYFLMNASKRQIEEALFEIEIAVDEKKNMLPPPAETERSITEVIISQNKTQKTDLQSRIKRVHLFKVNQSKNFTSCHRCQNVIKKQATVKCLKCKNCFCLECLDQAGYIPNKQITFQALEENFYQHCLVCKNTCRCLSCSEKVKSIPQQKQKKDLQKSVSYQLNSCFACKLVGRIRDPIDLECIHCKKLECVTCLKLEKKISDNYFNESWACEKCSINNIFRFDSRNFEPVNKAATSLRDYQTVEGIRRRSQLEERQRQHLVEQQLMRNQEQRGREEVQLERSRKKNRQKVHSPSKSRSSSSDSSSGFSSSSKRSFSEQSSPKAHEKPKRRSQSRSRSRSRPRSRSESSNRIKSQGRQRYANTEKNKRGNNKSWRGNRGQFRGRGKPGNQQKWRNKNSFQKDRSEPRNISHSNQLPRDIQRRSSEKNEQKPLWNSELEQKNKKKEENRNGNLFFNPKNSVVEEEFDY